MTETQQETNKRAASSLAEVQDTLARISSHKGVEAVMIMNRHGAILQSTFKEEQRLEHAAMLLKLTETATTLITSMDETDELSFLRLRSKKHEIMVAPDKEYLLVVLQNPTDAVVNS